MRAGPKAAPARAQELSCSPATGALDSTVNRLRAASPEVSSGLSIGIKLKAWHRRFSSIYNELHASRANSTALAQAQKLSLRTQGLPTGALG